jgi:hypothetical protein
MRVIVRSERTIVRRAMGPFMVSFMMRRRITTG